MAAARSVAAAARVVGQSDGTITTWRRRAGAHRATVPDRWLRQLQLAHLQMDELRTRLRDRAHVLWLWVVLDPLTTRSPVLHRGARTQDAAHGVVHDLRERLAPGCLPVFTSDGLNLYCSALSAHFGTWMSDIGHRVRRWEVAAGLLYGQVKKPYRRRKVVQVRRVMRCGTAEDLRTARKALGLSGRLNTAGVERVNLTIRHGVAAVARRTWATAPGAPALLAHREGWRG